MPDPAGGACRGSSRLRSARAGVDPGAGVLASVFEPEGLSLVTAQEQADRAGLAYDFVTD